MLIGLGIIVVLIIGIAIGFYSGGKQATTTTSVVTTVPTTSTLTTSIATTSISTAPLKSHQIILGYHTSSFLVGAGLKTSINFTVPEGAVQGQLDGVYTSTSGIDVAMVTMAQYSAINSNPGTITCASNYYGSGTTGTIATPLTPGNYSLIFYNPSSSAVDNVTISQTILLSYYASS